MAYEKRKTQQFKTFNRQRRIQYSDDSFASGMNYVTKPLDTGFVRNIVNMDLSSDGTSITPRKGLRVFEYAENISNTSYEDLKNYNIMDAAEIAEEDGNTYRQIILGKPVISNSDVIKIGNVKLVTVLPIQKEIRLFDKLDLPDYETYVEDFSDYDFFFKCPNEADIHNIELEDTSTLADIIGTRLTAEGLSKFYCFRRHKTTKKVELVFTTLTQNPVKHYTFEVLNPQNINAYNARLAMYNMLMEDPYSFIDDYNSPSLQFMGVYAIDKTTGKQCTPNYIQGNYKYRMNYSTAKNQKYKVVWEWKTPVDDTFKLLKEEVFTFSETTPRPMELDTNFADYSVILRIQCFPHEPNATIIRLKTFGSAPKNPANGDKYYDDDRRRIFTYSNGAWDDGVYPRTSEKYQRADDADTLYRWVGTNMEKTDEFSYIASNAMLYNIKFSETYDDSVQNNECINYDLSTCKGLVTWGQRLCAYAPDKAPNMVFYSEPNNPAWFPYPRNVSLFNETVIKCVPYLDYLLVFTTSAIYRVSQDNTGDSWTEQCLQKNLNIRECDTQFIKIIKNMVFFKSSNYFYMVVPNTSSVTGLTVAPISNNIENLLDSFDDSVKDIFKEMYDNPLAYNLVDFRNHVDYKNVYNVYTFKTSNNLYINFYLIYNIATRYWYSYIIQSEDLIRTYKIDVADVNIYLTKLFGIDAFDNLRFGLQFLKYNNNRQDFQIKDKSNYNDDVEGLYFKQLVYKNYQYIDTGYREHNSDFKKRFRELQFKLNNTSQVDLKFYTKFMIDGYERQMDGHYETRIIVDPEDARYGEIVYEKVYTEKEGKYVPGSTVLGATPLIPVTRQNTTPTGITARLGIRPVLTPMLGTSESFNSVNEREIIPDVDTSNVSIEYEHNPDEQIYDKNLWKLDVSSFPETVFWKTRFPVSGKGYTPRLKILNTDQEDYEILNINWVFRNLYSR